MLAQIKKFFQKQPIATLAQVAMAIQTDTEATRQMLTYFEKKGSLKCLSLEAGECATTGTSCKGCPTAKCHQSQTTSVLYQWFHSA
jgi:hypothetical protein